MERTKKFWYQVQTGLGGNVEEAIYPGDLYIMVQDTWGVEDYAMDILTWAEEAKFGDIYIDDNLKIVAV